MTDENRKTPQVVAQKPTTDMNEHHLAIVERYKEAGLPGISEVSEAEVSRMADLYLAGQSYNKISNICRVKKEIVLYLAHRMNWYEHRQNYLEDLDHSMKQRVAEARLMSQDFMLQMQLFFEKKIGRNIRRYLNTDSEDIANELNLKDVATYIKTLEALGKSINDFKGPDKAPAVSLNMGEGVTMKKNDDGSVEITPKQKASSEILKEFADMRRKEEKK
jgi:hypothetical protein